MNLWLVLAVFFILGLMLIAAYYQFLLYRHKKKQEASQEEFQQEIQKRRERGAKSIVLLCKAILAEQVSLTEAGIRINALSILLMDTRLVAELSVFRQLSEATAHIPILEDWRKLDKNQQLAFDSEREAIEEKFKDFVFAIANRIVHENLLNFDGAAAPSAEAAESAVKEYTPKQ